MGLLNKKRHHPEEINLTKFILMQYEYSRLACCALHYTGLVAGINRQPNILEKYELQKDAGAKKLAESIASGFLNSLPGYSFIFSPNFHEHLQVRWVERSSDDANHRTYALEIEMPEISKGKLKESHGIKASKDVPALKWFSDRDLRAGDGAGLIQIETNIEDPKLEAIRRQAQTVIYPSRRKTERKWTHSLIGEVVTGRMFPRELPLSTPSSRALQRIQLTCQTCKAGCPELCPKTLGLAVLTSIRRNDRLSDFPGRMSRFPKAFFCKSLSLYCPCRIPRISAVVCDIG